MRTVALPLTVVVLALAGCSSKASAPACVPQSASAFCTEQGIACGAVTATDNCGASRTVASCGTCAAPLSCGGGGATGRCGCTPQSNADFCTSQGIACGAITATDNCGASRTVASCGTCSALLSCGGGGTPGVCACTPETEAQLCTAANRTCGGLSVTDNCGASRTVASCGTCAAPLSCGGGGATGHCGCTPQSNADFCTSQGIACGTVTATDNCGASRTVASCGACSAPLSCGGGGTPGVCACTPETDAQLCTAANRTCGGLSVTDHCGAIRNVVSCGTCAATLTCGGAGTAGQCGLPPITGKVVDENGTPVPTAKVAVLGLATVATTDATGAFTLPGVGHAYDIAAALGTNLSAVVYRGATRSDPTLVLPLPAAAGARQATLTVTATPASTPGNFWSVGWAPRLASQPSQSGQSPNSLPSSTSLTPTWNGPWTSLSGNLWAFERDSSGKYVRTGTLTGVSVTNGQNTPVSIPMTAATSGTVSGTSGAALGAGFTTFWSTGLHAETDHFLVILAGKSYSPIPGAPAADGPFSFPSPVGSGFGLRVTAFASGTDLAVQSCVQVTANSTNVTLTIPAGPAPFAPATGATLPAATAQFQWTTGGASLYQFQLDSTPSRLNVYTTATSAAIPDLSSLGWTLPTGAYQWTVMSAIPALATVGPTIDDAAAGPLQWNCSWSKGITMGRTITFN
jgi:hypothetical protein